MFFEGVEKKIVVRVSDKHISLRQLDADFWARLVSFAGASILSTINSAQCDAYLLSESSLFVWDNTFLMLTCGDSTLVDSLMHFMTQVDEGVVIQVRYYRRNEFMPALQQQHFFDDVTLIKQKMNGRAYRIGHLDGHHQYVFNADVDAVSAGLDSVDHDELEHVEVDYLKRRNLPNLSAGLDALSHGEVNHGEVNTAELKPSLTGCELLMYHIQGEFATYLRSDIVSSEGIQKRLALETFFPLFTLDDHCFSPYGYSINGVREAHYFTIHITPQTQSSYVSVDTNIADPTQYSALVEHFLSLFSPQKWDVQTLNTAFVLPSNQGAVCLLESQLSLSNTEKLFFYQYQLNNTEVLPAYAL